MTGSPPLLAIEDLSIDLPTRDGMSPVIHRVDLTVPATAVGLVGESQSGKSMTARAVLWLLPAARATGTVRLDGRDVATLGTARLRALRGREVAMIFQDPRAHIDPVRTVGDFLTEALITTRGVRPGVAETTVTALLRDVRIADASRRMRQRPPTCTSPTATASAPSSPPSPAAPSGDHA
ncbi:ATP-binding cassette domain-containing protein [Streptomyces phaeoluteigriseus]|uniref:ATP-binding cassette domain-containing protein n=1 Tax=Streptomyces phaeoluteigriseus TaxID=114686 RepID=UPI0036CC3A0A